MSDFEYYDDYDELERKRRLARKRRKEERRRKRRRQVMINRIIFGICCVLIVVALSFGIKLIVSAIGASHSISSDSLDNQLSDTITENYISENEIELKEEELVVSDNEISDNSVRDDQVSQNDVNSENALLVGEDPLKTPADYAFFESEATSYMGSEEMTSTYGILCNVQNKSIVSQKNCKDRISPASMTKVLTLLVACENIKSLDDTVEITIEATDYAYSNDCSSVGFAEGEKVTVEDLLYGTILPSGGDAAYALACYVAGSHDAFVEMMNNKLNKLGISDSAHFTNCVGIYDDNHYCNVYDIAVIMEAAMDNPMCAKVLNTRKYTTTNTPEHPEGIDISNLFMRRIEDKDTKGEVMGAKTGYVVQSGNCAVSYYTCNDGQNYVCVTADAHSAWRCVYDHVAVYNIYAAGNTGYKKDSSSNEE